MSVLYRDISSGGGVGTVCIDKKSKEKERPEREGRKERENEKFFLSKERKELCQVSIY